MSNFLTNYAQYVVENWERPTTIIQPHTYGKSKIRYKVEDSTYTEPVFIFDEVDAIAPNQIEDLLRGSKPYQIIGCSTTEHLNGFRKLEECMAVLNIPYNVFNVESPKWQ